MSCRESRACRRTVRRCMRCELPPLKNDEIVKILEVQAIVEEGAGKEKIGLRGPMPPGVLFAVYDSETGTPEYIPPEYIDIPELLDELVEYVNTMDDRCDK